MPSFKVFSLWACKSLGTAKIATLAKMRQFTTLSGKARGKLVWAASSSKNAPGGTSSGASKGNMAYLGQAYRFFVASPYLAEE